MNINDLALVGVILIILIICLSLFIFAPKSINYYPDAYPDITNIYNNSIHLIKKDLEKIKDKDWLKWPDKEHIVGNVSTYPLYMFSIPAIKRKKICYNTYSSIKKITNVKSCTFIKFDANSKLTKNQQWQELANNTLRVLFILEAGFSTSDEKLGIWVNGEIKKIKDNSVIVYDSSKEHTIYNNTKVPMYLLLIDVARPNDVARGASTRKYDDQVQKFITRI